jgi:hypothetical protein
MFYTSISILTLVFSILTDNDIVKNDFVRIAELLPFDV